MYIYIHTTYAHTHTRTATSLCSMCFSPILFTFNNNNAQYTHNYTYTHTTLHYTPKHSLFFHYSVTTIEIAKTINESLKIEMKTNVRIDIKNLTEKIIPNL